MKKLTITFNELEDGSWKATVYEGDNKYLYEALGMSMYTALMNVATRFTFYKFDNAKNESLSRRAD